MAMLGNSLLEGTVLFVSSFLLFAWLYFWYKFSYWQRRGVPHSKPTMIFGSYKDCVLQKECVGQFMQRMYNEGVGNRFFGCYVFTRPALVLRDPELMKEILVKEFNTFFNRNAQSNHQKDPLSQNLFLIKGELWRHLRLKMSPIFTSFRLKQMFPLINTCGKQLCQYVERSDKQIEMKEVAGKYATDVITTCAFGIESNSLLNPNAEFREFGRKIFDFSVYRSFEFMSAFMLPLVAKLMGITFFSRETTKFMRKTFWETIQEREEKKIERHDFLELLIKLKNGKDITNEKSMKNWLSTETLNGTTDVSNGIMKDSKPIQLEGDILVAQAAIFFTAGFESNASTTSFTLYELAMQPHLQTRLREEILHTLDKNEGQFTYEAIRDMEYLHMVISETLRKFPPLPILDRVAERDYVIPGTDITIEKGTTVYVPLLGIHMDPEVFPDPEHYDPERFNEKNRKARHPFMYLPFGEGPKYCIGKGFGLIASKVAVANVLANFIVSPCADTPSSIQLNPKAMILAARGGIRLKFTKLNR